MTDDIVARLNWWKGEIGELFEAAEEIGRLRIHAKIVEGQLDRMTDRWEAQQAEIERLRGALDRIASVNSVQAGPDKDMYRRWRKVATDAIDVARAALAWGEDK